MNKNTTAARHSSVTEGKLKEACIQHNLDSVTNEINLSFDDPEQQMNS